MKQKLLYLVLALLFVGMPNVMLAQQKNNKRSCLNFEQRVKRQTAHIAKNLMLDDQKTAQFSELYTQYLRELHKNMQSENIFDYSNMGKNNRTNWTDEQVEKMLQLRFDKSRAILNLREKYYHEFKKVLTPRQILKMYTLERNFGKAVQQELEKRYNRKKDKK